MSKTKPELRYGSRCEDKSCPCQDTCSGLHAPGMHGVRCHLTKSDEDEPGVPQPYPRDTPQGHAYRQGIEVGKSFGYRAAIKGASWPEISMASIDRAPLQCPMQKDFCTNMRCTEHHPRSETESSLAPVPTHYHPSHALAKNLRNECNQRKHDHAAGSNGCPFWRAAHIIEAITYDKFEALDNA